MKLRHTLVLLSLLLPRAFAATAIPVGNAPTQKPEPPARPAAPAFVDMVTFNIMSGGDKQQLTVVSAPGLVRVDSPVDRLSVLYNPATQYYTGLEHSNYTYWEFSWPKVRDAVQNTPRYATRLREMGPELLEENAISSSPTSPDPATLSPSSNSAGDDNSGYVWHTDPAKKRVAGIDCVHWVGETVSGEKIEAWCEPRLVPEVEQALATLEVINEPMALVPVRNFMPPLAFVAWKALSKAGVTPVLMTWGSDTEFNRFELGATKHRDGRVDDFRVPKAYIKTTIITMDGIGTQGVQGTPRPMPAKPLANPLLNNN